MTPETGLLASIARAEGHVRQARQSWDPCDLSGCEQCAGHLQQAIDEMKGAHESASGARPAPATKARLVRLRNEAEVLSRLVDSAMAFSLGLALRTVSEEPVHSELKG